MVTLVSGFWDLPQSKFDTPTYLKWFENALPIQAPMIFYLEKPDPELESLVLKCRGSFNLTQFRYRTLQDFQVLKQSQVEQFKDRTHSLHCPNIHLGRVWLEKIALVLEASVDNPFQTEWFAWYDAGMCSFRDSKPPLQLWPNPQNMHKLKSECLNFTHSPEWTDEQGAQFPKGTYFHLVTGTWLLHRTRVQVLYQQFLQYWTQLEQDCKVVDPWAFLNDQTVWTMMKLEHPEWFHCIGHSYGTYPQILGVSRSECKVNRRISILMPIYHTKSEYLDIALNSIVNQQFDPQVQMEWVIVNDGMDEKHTQYLESKLRLITSKRLFIVYHKFSKNRGVGASAQKALELSSGELLFRMDADDIALPERFQKQIVYMDTHPECPALGAQIKAFHIGKLDEAPNSQLPLIVTLEEFRKKNIDWFSAHPTMCYRRSVLEKVGGYNVKQAKMVEDYDLHLRILREFGSLHNHPETLLHYRFHPDQVTTSSHLKGESPYWVEKRKELLQKWIYE